jgi:organic hydroperoxide reductase OsmC/OhrA
MSKPDKSVLYTAKTHTTGGRDGASRSSDGRLEVKCPVPAVTAAAPIGAAFRRRLVGLFHQRDGA